jgi:hypothetical protein
MSLIPSAPFRRLHLAQSNRTFAAEDCFRLSKMECRHRNADSPSNRKFFWLWKAALQILPSVSIVSAALVIAALGAIGGLVNCAIAGEFALPHIDREAKVWRPGWIGNVVVGAVAAPVIWGIYGPLAGHAITGADKIDLTLAQVFVSVVIGLGGGRILTLEAQKQAERVAKNNITKLVEESIVESEDQK